MSAASTTAGTPTPDSDPAGGPALRRAGWWSLGLPLGLSIFVHAAIASVVAVVAWQIAMPSSEPPPTEAFIAVATPMSTVPERVSMPEPAPRSAPSAPAAPATPEPGPRPAAIVTTPGPAAPAPVAAAAQTITSALSESPPVIVSFAGLSAKRAASVAYVIDGSAPMLGVLPRVLAEVSGSASALLPVQQFSVVVFHQETPAEGEEQKEGLPPPPPPGSDVLSARLLDASPRNLARLSDWLARIEPRGSSNPLEGLRVALQLKPRPQVIFLLSRSIARSHGGQWGGGKEAILEELERLNPRDSAGHRRTVIKALQFLEPDPTGTMQAIAEKHGGGGTTPDYRVLRTEELPRSDR